VKIRSRVISILSDLLKRNALLAVFKVNNTAPLKPGFYQRALHRYIIAVRVYLQIRKLSKALRKAKRRHAAPVRILRHRNAVYHRVRLVI
jgi:hypothetical protein